MDVPYVTLINHFMYFGIMMGARRTCLPDLECRPLEGDSMQASAHAQHQRPRCLTAHCLTFSDALTVAHPLADSHHHALMPVLYLAPLVMQSRQWKLTECPCL